MIAKHYVKWKGKYNLL